jgi:hypothetical protein
MKKLQIQIGDIFEIPLPDGRKTIGQYVYEDKRIGPIIQIYNYFISQKETFNIQEIKEKKLLFYTILGGIYVVFRSKEWKIIGHEPIKNFKYPGFISTLTNSQTGEATTWYLWNGEQWETLGKHLPNEYKHLEFASGYSPDSIIKRIMTGKNPKEELIMTNKETVQQSLVKEEKEKNK